ncbi:4-deoxy-4-formamido-L-arabinose-phosphoundecaprenol deformylase [Luteolibacter yonseiensis]|uniref:4-deoxy-4-formamido-L-arabinose-phosphoundecaprenol deformylase n=1 Tax=Luteolibacter yonseiensis TaxID=1144680 RepID=A0A934VCZ1_9BACT|nr:4-deoxy-4-formamido-L-arabinose-phosphoundecaprenol deformylase [Luteolibacter yonseiensis]MBK1816999.1 4-deoxy-4-formamido-L-arabinose-phosphoundecaprenol deformylase [Luteolibacter yonseiensis]
MALKIDVDTERGTREGVPSLVSLLEEYSATGTFLFSLGPDNTGKAIRRVFRPGFFKKVSRTSVVKMYGIRTLLNGTLLPAPHIGKRHAEVMREVEDAGFETGIHCYDHFRWQDHLLGMSVGDTRLEFGRALDEFRRIFGRSALSAGAPGWQANGNSRQVYDDAALLYASDSRGSHPYFPLIDNRVYKTLEIPTTLPTFDELLGRREYPDTEIVQHYMNLLSHDRPNVMTIHAEIEGMMKRPLFAELLEKFNRKGVKFVKMENLAKDLLSQNEPPPVCQMVMDCVDGRSGKIATQGRQLPRSPPTHMFNN